MKSNNTNIISNDSIAIIGMGAYFPKSFGLKEYWQLIFQGEDAITDVPKSHWSAKDYFNDDPKKPDHIYCKRGGFLSPISFDPSEFGIPPNLLEATDTSQILSLVIAKMALTDAGYGEDLRDFDNENTSVFLGVTGTQELVIPLSTRLGHPVWRKALQNCGISSEKTEEVIKQISDSYVSWQENSFPGLLGNVVSGRVSNRFNLKGTNTVVDAACASSLSAVNHAMLDLLSHRSNMAITGGVDTLNDIFMHMCFAKTSVLSYSNDAKPFSIDSDGTVLAEGIGMVVLKRLEDAKRDNDRIYAVIKGMGTSSDGKSGSIYAPNSKGQLKALEAAYKEADISPETVELIEAHGTGTKVGDAVEFNAVSELFSRYKKEEDNWCALGTVKSMIGHAKAAAGVAGLIKTTLSLYNKVLPPTLKAQTPNPELNIKSSPFYLNSKARPWISSKNHPRRAGVSAFGFGGSNFHAVLEEYNPVKDHISWTKAIEIIAFSADTKEQLLQKLIDFQKLVKKDVSLKEQDENFSYLMYQNRLSFLTDQNQRITMVFDKDSIISKIIDKAVLTFESKKEQSSWSINEIYYGSGRYNGKMAFMFPGQGSQYCYMGRDILCTFPKAAEVLSKANLNFQLETKEKKQSLCDYIYPLPEYMQSKKEADDNLRNTDIAQIAIGTISLAMTKVLDEFGIKADYTCGHSFGELTALCSANWIDENSFLSLAIARGKFMAQASKNSDDGSMLAVRASLEKIEKFIKQKCPNLTLANRNSYNQGVLSGTTEDILEALQLLKKEKIRAVKLPVAAAFHTNLVKSAVEPFKNILKKFKITPNDTTVFSNTTGKPYPKNQDKATQILGNQLISSVYFVEEIENLYNAGVKTFVEVGPKSVLTGLVESILKDKNCTVLALDASSNKDSGIKDLAKTLAILAASGYEVLLDKWEDRVTKKKEKKITVSVCGANPIPTNPIPTNPIPTNPIPTKTNFPTKTNSPTKINSPTKTNSPTKNNIKNNVIINKPEKVKQIKNSYTNNGDIVKSSINSDKSYTKDALKVVQEGLQAMHSLHSQTTDAHKLFLETQAEAGRALQSMMDKTRFLINMPDNIEESTILKSKNKAKEHHVSAVDYENIKQNISNTPSSFHSEPLEDTINFSEEIKPLQVVKSEPLNKTDNIDTIISVIEEVVSNLTGYPIEMLDIDMDIESDLGIDSIKRVEILSAVEEKLPEVHSISPEEMGTIKTLRQIAIHLTGSNENSFEQYSNTDNSNKILPEKKIFESNKISSDSIKNEITENLLQVVSSLTGYPIEMLEIDMDIESDLGIDSIKRVEILSAFEESMPDTKSISPDVMGELKTLKHIIDYLSDSSNPEEKQNLTVKKKLQKASSPVNINRQVVSVNYEPLNDIKNSYHKVSILDGYKIVITNGCKEDNCNKVALQLADELKSMKIASVIIGDNFIEDVKNITNIGGLVIIPPFIKPSKHNKEKKDPKKKDLKKEDYKKEDIKFLKKAFELTKYVSSKLIQAGKKGGAVFATVSYMDGCFGFNGVNSLNRPLLGGIAGLAKTAAIEWPNVNSRAFDISPDFIDSCARLLALEIISKGPVETGFIPNFRTTLTLKPSKNYDNSLKVGELNLSESDVVIITGGARGVTASCAKAVVQKCKATIILLGRSPKPFVEPNWLENITTEGEIKQAILKNEDFNGEKATPSKVEKLYKTYMANREITSTIADIKDSNASCAYYSVDVRNKKDMKTIIGKIEKKYGSISAIIHGAGVLKDRFIADKTQEQFNIVFDTKVTGLELLLKFINKNNLKYLILFSSVSARMGNSGQADYAMANEILNKSAVNESILLPTCKVLSINWGPWDGGMVTTALKNQFKQNNIELIPLEYGASCMVEEMSSNNKDIEVIIGAPIIAQTETIELTTGNSSTFKLDSTKKTSELLKAFNVSVDVESYPILNSHIIANRFVVPFAIMTEWFGHGALHANPGLYLYGIDDMRLLNGITLEKEEQKDISIWIEKIKRIGLKFEMQMEIKSNLKDIMLHAKGRAILTEKIPDAPVFTRSIKKIAQLPYPFDIKSAYNNILFHGNILHGIKKIHGISDMGMVANIACASPPEKWIKNPQRSKWILDPLILDCAFQLAVLWTDKQTGNPCLPSYMANYRQFAKEFPKDGVTAILIVNELLPSKIICDFTFLDEQNQVVACITGYEATINSKLKIAFHPERFEKTVEKPIFTREQLLQFSSGKPSLSFGDKYKIFDTKRKMARLPRPPYFFIDNIITINHKQWELVPGGWIEAIYNNPADAWYFTANDNNIMPYCILLEIALQPCGWLAAYAGSALTSEERLKFRNLDGNAVLYKNINKESNQLKTRCRLTKVSKAGGLLIEQFDVQVLQDNEIIYEADTTFGFFTEETLKQQTGIQNYDDLNDYELLKHNDSSKKYYFEKKAPLTPDDNNVDSVEDKSISLIPSGALLMIDQVDIYQPKGGTKELGFIHATKKVDPDEWFFQAHFYQDPVCPGSLGIESFIQLLKVVAIDRFANLTNTHKIKMITGNKHSWTYRGQIIPTNNEIEVEADIIQLSEFPVPTIMATGYLKVDGLVIYKMENFGIQLVKVAEDIEDIEDTIDTIDTIDEKKITSKKITSINNLS